jgi:hypothetical protein
MNDQDTIRLLRGMYAGALADAATQMERAGVLAQVTARKREEQASTGAARARQLGLTDPSQVPVVLSAVFRCADWKAERVETGFVAETRTCMLCGLSKKMGGARPCEIYCLHPMEGMIRGIDPSIAVTVTETLWDGQKCRLEARRTAAPK